MLCIGCHLSVSGGFLSMARQAQSIGADTFAFFVRNPRGSSTKSIDLADIQNCRKFLIENNFGKLVAHAPYTMNLCSADAKVRHFSKQALQEDIQKLENLPGNYYNFHPGSHVKQGVEIGIKLISQQLNSVLTEKQSTIVLLETMAGKGSEIGGNFREIRDIIDRVELKDKLGVCLDTCHVWDGGYDIVNSLDKVLDEFDKIIGLEKLKAVHLNDSLNPCNSHKDRHARIGEGHIGSEALVRVVNHSALRELPFILETPNDMDGYAREIKFLRENYK